MRAAEPGFLVFVLGLGVIVAAASHRRARVGGRGARARAARPAALLLIALIGALLANLVNNLPATLILVPVAAAVGPARCSRC